SYPFINHTTITRNRVPNESAIIVVNESLDLSQLQNIATEANANSTIAATKPKRFAGMTYVAGLSEKLSKMLTRIAPNVIVAPRPIAKVGEMFTDLKQKLTTDQQSFV
ncbi:hypothetical protein HA402_011422, partial [Bradysia odoriphaga]